MSEVFHYRRWITSNDNIINVDQNVNVGNPTLILEKIEKEQDQS